MAHKKYRAYKRRPAYYTGFPSQYFDFDTVEELLSWDWVRGFANPTNQEKRFHRFSIYDTYLMVEYDEGYEWWAIAVIKIQKDSIGQGSVMLC